MTVLYVTNGKEVGIRGKIPDSKKNSLRIATSFPHTQTHIVIPKRQRGISCITFEIININCISH